MTTATATQRPVHPELAGAKLSFPRLVRSEWIKLRSIRSTWWCWGILIIVTVGLGALVGGNVHAYGEHGELISVHGVDAQRYVVTAATVGVIFAQLVAAVLGVLVIAGEYTTGMVRGTFSAAPRRIGSLLAKALVLSVSTFVVTAIGIWASALVTWPLLRSNKIDVDLGNPAVYWPLFGAALYVTLTTLLAFGLGLLLRNAAGGIATAMGVLLILPIVAVIVYSATSQPLWLYNVIQFLPANAGGHLYGFQGGDPAGFSFNPGPPTDDQGKAVSGAIQMHALGGFITLLAEVVVIGGVAAVLAKRRDA